MVSLLAVGDARQLQVLRLELMLVVGQVGSSVPKEPIACPHRLLLALTTKVHIDLNGCLQSVTVDLLLVAIPGKLVNDSTLQLLLKANDHSVFELRLAEFSQRVHVVASEVVSINVREGTI